MYHLRANFRSFTLLTAGILVISQTEAMTKL
jgi:hypothetical protein